jgi:hypothetical protein
MLLMRRLGGRRCAPAGGQGNSWGGNPPAGVPHVVVTHSVADGWLDKDTAVPFTFVTGGIESSINEAKAITCGKWVAVSGGTIARQCLDAGLLEEISVALVARPAWRWHALLQPAETRTRRAGRAGHHRRHRRHPPALSRAGQLKDNGRDPTGT